MSKSEKAYYIKTNISTGATIVTGLGKAKYVEYDIQNPREGTG